jgi:hypothetical protein
VSDWAWESYEIQASRRSRNSNRTQVQKGGVVYSEDIENRITSLEEVVRKWDGENLDRDQKIWRLTMSTSILPQLLLKTKGLKQIANRSAINTAKRAGRRIQNERS